MEGSRTRWSIAVFRWSFRASFLRSGYFRLRRRSFLLWLALCGLVLLGRLRLDQQQSIVKLDVVLAAKMESFVAAIVLAVGRAKEVSAGRTTADRLHKHVAVLEAGQVQVAQRVFPEGHR